MQKPIRKAAGAVLLTLLMIVSLSSCSFSGAVPKTVTKRFYADSPNDKYGFEASRTFDGKQYQLTDEKYKVIRSTSDNTSELTAISVNRTAFSPGRILKMDGKSYVVQNVKVQNETLTQEQAVESRDNAPGEITRTYEDKSGLKTNLTYQLSDVTENTDKSWTDSGSFDINLVGYGGSYYDIGTTKLSGKDTLKDIQKKQTAVLKAQGLDPKTTRITQVSWKAKEYKDKAGNRCRDVEVYTQTQAAPLTGHYTATLYRFTVSYAPQGSKPTQYLLEGKATYQPAAAGTVGWIRIVLLVILAVGLIALLFLGRYFYKERKLLKSGKEVREIDGVRYTEDDF